MKYLKKSICTLLMLLALSCSSAVVLSCATTPITAEAASIKINKKKIVLDKGKTFQLKIQGTKKKVTWKSNKPSVAKVSSKGKVTAKKKGTAKITAKVNGKKYTCTVTVTGKSIEHTKHTYVITNTIKPTCTEKGKKTYKCSVCGRTKEEAYGSALGHNYKRKHIAATCTEHAKDVSTCTRCNYSYEKIYDFVLGHDYDYEYIEPTCTENGKKIYTCRRCNDTYEEFYMNALGHSYDKTGVCDRCGVKNPNADIVIPVSDFYVASAIRSQLGLNSSDNITKYAMEQLRDFELSSYMRDITPLRYAINLNSINIKNTTNVPNQDVLSQLPLLTDIRVDNLNVNTDASFLKDFKSAEKIYIFTLSFVEDSMKYVVSSPKLKILYLPIVSNNVDNVDFFNNNNSIEILELSVHFSSTDLSALKTMRKLKQLRVSLLGELTEAQEAVFNYLVQNGVNVMFT